MQTMPRAQTAVAEGCAVPRDARGRLDYARRFWPNWSRLLSSAFIHASANNRGALRDKRYHAASMLKYMSGIMEAVTKSTHGYFRSVPVVRGSFSLPAIAVLFLRDELRLSTGALGASGGGTGAGVYRSAVSVRIALAARSSLLIDRFRARRRGP